jgi:acetyl-CoA acetyltransferase
MNDVFVIGAGMARFQKYGDVPITSYAAPAVRRALDDAGLDLRSIDFVTCGARDVGLGPGAQVLGAIGRVTVPILNVEGASASGGVAFHEAYFRVAYGTAEVALAMGVGKNSAPVGHLGSPDAESRRLERAMGLLPAAGKYAMRLRRRELQSGSAVAACVEIAVKAHRNGQHNPYAHRNRPVTAEDVRNSRRVCDPLTAYQCCPSSDGAAAVVLASRAAMNRIGADCAIRVAASAFLTYTGVQDEGSERSSTVTTMAYEAAGVGPEDVSLVEAYDSFAVQELEQYEALGFAAPGDAERLALDGDTALGGKIPFGTDGGNLSRGHGIGPTGLAQVWEVVNQLRGTAGARQVDQARVGLCHQLGASGEALSHILVRD